MPEKEEITPEQVERFFDLLRRLNAATVAIVSVGCGDVEEKDDEDIPKPCQTEAKASNTAERIHRVRQSIQAITRSAQALANNCHYVAQQLGEIADEMRAKSGSSDSGNGSHAQ